MRISWELTTSQADANRQQFMALFTCCGFDRVTDSYQLNVCQTDLNKFPTTLACKAAMGQYMNENVYPVGSVCIGLGVVEVQKSFCV